MQAMDGEGLKSLAAEIQKLIEDEESGVLVLVTASTGSAPGKVGAKMLVYPDGEIHGTIGGGVVEARATADALNALEDGRGPRSARYNLDELGMSCGGEMALYLEPLQPPRRVIVFGAGHVGTAVARQLGLLDCRLTVVDERRDWASPDRFGEEVTLVNQPFAAYLTDSPPGPKDHVIIVTRGHEQDQLVLEHCVERQPAYLGMIGSRKKAARALEQLRQRGVAEEAVAAIRSPMGIDIGAVSPEEIAVSLAAELILLWRRGALPERRRPAPAKSRRQPAAAESKLPVREVEPPAPAAARGADEPRDG